MTDMAELYADTQKPNWAGGQYRSLVMESRSYDYEIMNTRGNGRDYEISLPCELVGESAPDRALPVLIDGDTDPLKQVGAVFADGADTGFIRFSRSERGKKWQKSFLAGEAQIELAPPTRGRSMSWSAFAIRAVSDGTIGVKKRSDQTVIPKEILIKEVDEAVKRRIGDQMRLTVFWIFNQFR